MLYSHGMRKNCKSITTSPEIITNIAELSKMNFDLLTKLVPWLDASEKTQQKFQSAVLGKLSRIEAAISILLVGQMAQTQGQRPIYNEEDLEKDAKAAEEFISKQALEGSLAIVKYIFKERATESAPHDRRRKWHGWEI
jgi:hypothetical protein